MEPHQVYASKTRNEFILLRLYKKDIRSVQKWKQTAFFKDTRQEKMQKIKTIGRKIVLGKEDSEFVVRLLTKRSGKRFCCKNGKYTLKTKH